MKKVNSEKVWFWECPYCLVNDFAEYDRDHAGRLFNFIVECDNCNNEIEVNVDDEHKVHDVDDFYKKDDVDEKEI